MQIMSSSVFLRQKKIGGTPQFTKSSFSFFIYHHPFLFIRKSWVRDTARPSVGFQKSLVVTFPRIRGLRRREAPGKAHNNPWYFGKEEKGKGRTDRRSTTETSWFDTGLRTLSNLAWKVVNGQNRGQITTWEKNICQMDTWAEENQRAQSLS